MISRVQDVTEGRTRASVCERIFQISFEKLKFPARELEITELNFDGENLRRVINDLSSEGIIQLLGKEIEVRNRISLAEILVKAGRSAESLSARLSWREFERFCRNVLEENGFQVRSNLRFTQNRKRYEIDLVAAKRPYLLFIDCKHWRLGGRSRYLKAAQKQQLRMEAALKKESVIGIRAETRLSSFQRMSLIVSLGDVSANSFQTIPVVSIFRFNSFLMGLDQFFDELNIARQGGHVLEDWIDS